MLDRRDLLLGAGGLVLAGVASSLRAATAETAPRLVGFVSGIDSYREIRPLDRAVKDARAIAGRVGAFGYDVVVAENVGVSAFHERFGRFLDKVGPDSATFLYLACHGVQVGGRNFILPADVKGSSGDAMLEGSIQTDDLLQQIASRNPRQCIVLFDACRDEPLDVTITGRADGFTSTNSPGGFYVAYSAGAGQFAIDNLGDKDKDPNGLFVRCLMKELAPDVSIDDIIKTTREEVTATAQTVGRNQSPAIYDQARRDLRLDGVILPPRRRPVQSRARLDGAGVLIVALQEYFRYSDMMMLGTPYADAHRLAEDFKRLGAEPTILREPSREEVLQASREFGAKDYRRRFLYLSGSGSLVDRDGWLNVPISPADKRPDRRWTSTRGVATTPAKPAPYSLGDLTRVSTSEIFLAMVEGARAAKKKRSEVGVRGVALAPDARNPGQILRDTHMFCDFCLSEYSTKIPVIAASSAEPSGWNILEALHEEVFAGFGERNPAAGIFPGCSILFASGFFQEALDAAPGQSSSPFAIALRNSLGQPGLSVAQFADRVRTEVEVLTSRLQSPMLVCNPATFDRVMIDLVG